MRAAPSVVDRDREILVAKLGGIAHGVDVRAAGEAIRGPIFPSELEYYELTAVIQLNGKPIPRISIGSSFITGSPTKDEIITLYHSV